ncbi:E3 ubiquitin-protein ligase Topors-like isoform X2 [Leptopilina boulardi]|nr:E3 ubiquitin-protein ligase Topors-like isoform X2 [Leptopilina boulardi]
MEEQTERKASATAVAEEPIKAEGTVETSDTSERSDGAASPPPNCSICLGKLVNTSFTDSCLHQFCFTCLLQWSKIKTECPLCKQTFKSIIHNVRSEEDYDQYHVPRELASQVATATLDVNFDFVNNVGPVSVGSYATANWDIGIRRFMYRSTLGNPSRRVSMILNPHEVARREQLPSIAPQLTRDELRRRQINPSDFRRNVYRLGVWASPLPDVFGRFRECSAELYRRHPAEINRLIPWLNRELQVLLNNNSPHVAYVLRIITDALTRYYIRSIEFRNLIRPYFGIHTEHFTHELANFARTSFDMVGYDQSVIYLPSRTDYTGDYGARILSPGSSSSSTTSDDSDVRVVDDTVDRRGLNLRFSTLISNSIIDMPGPSTLPRPFHNYAPPITVPDIVLVSSSSSSSDDECEVIGYVKPRHERTPEIIDLSNSETEEPASQTIELNDTLPPPIVIDENQPSTSQEVRKVRKADSALPVQMMEILSTPTYSEISDSDSDYNPRRKHKANTKKTVKRRKLSTARKNVKTKRQLPLNTFSSSSESETKHTKRTTKKETKHSRRVSVSSGTTSEKLKKTKSKSKKRDTSVTNSDTPFYATSESDNDEKKYQNELLIHNDMRYPSISVRIDQRDSDTLSESEKPINLSISSYNSYVSNEKENNLQEKIDNLNETMATNSATIEFKEKQEQNDEEEEEEEEEEEGTSSDCSVDDLKHHHYYRSRCQCSVCSDNTRTSKKKSKHKDKRNHKSDKSSSTKYYHHHHHHHHHSIEGNSMSSLNDAPSSSKHSSDSKNSSRSKSSKTKHKSHKKSKTSKRRRSRSNSRSKSKKRATIDFQTK